MSTMCSVNKESKGIMRNRKSVGTLNVFRYKESTTKETMMEERYWLVNRFGSAVWKSLCKLHKN